LDVDHFKTINDVFGHAAGDVALRRIAQAMRRGCRQGDVVARFGGEEFLVLLPETSLGEATIVAERILDTIRQMTATFEGRQMRITASAGVAVASGTELGCDELVRRADRALYQSKSNGRDQVNCVALVSAGAPMRAEAHEDRRWTGS
jgi:diguanylate cyclase (GGDEF)-like protein